VSPPVQRRLFALDHNFPQPILAALADALPMAELVAISDIAPGFADLDDWDLLRELHRHERPWDGLITNDDSMLLLAKEMTVLSQTRLTLVVAQGQGHNPIRAVGVLLCHLAFICHQTTRDEAQIWNLRVAQRNHEPVGNFLEKIAGKKHTTIEQLVAANKLPSTDLRPP
jgi:hypothetical protein